MINLMVSWGFIISSIGLGLVDVLVYFVDVFYNVYRFVLSEKWIEFFLMLERVGFI